LDIVTVIGEGRKAFVALMNLRRTAQIQTSCFGAGTPLRTLTGHKLIEDVCVGDVLLSRSEKDLEGPLAGKVVEQIFVRTGEIWHLYIGGEVIRTTAEHPFWVQGKGWVATNELQQGDMLASHDGQWLLVEEVFNTGVWERVYNLRVEEFHTYFVGDSRWSFAVWAHNTNNPLCVGATAPRAKTPLQESQALTTKANKRLAGNLKLAQLYLSPKEINAAPGEFIHKLNYGKVIERMVAEEIGNSKKLRKLFEHLGGPSKPDFIGLGKAKGQIFDITTRKSIAAHRRRPYGKSLKIATYNRPKDI
jgi:hypothetical protein